MKICASKNLLQDRTLKNDAREPEPKNGSTTKSPISDVEQRIFEHGTRLDRRVLLEPLSVAVATPRAERAGEQLRAFPMNLS